MDEKNNRYQFIFPLIFLVFSACGNMKASVTKNSSKEIECSDDALNENSCKTSSNRYVYQNPYGGRTELGSDLIGADGQLTKSIPKGWYDGTQSLTVADSNLRTENIVSGVSIFGIVGSANGPYAACTNDSFNSNQCSASINSYVYSLQYGGRNSNCSPGLNVSPCWTNGTSQYLTSIAGGAIQGSDGSLSVNVPTGYYDGSTTASMTDSKLIASNLKNGISIFGVTGTYTGTFQLNMGSSIFKTSGASQMSLHDETVVDAGLNYGLILNRAIPDITKDDDGFFGGSITPVQRSGWGTTSCGLSQQTIAARIVDCAQIFGAASTWDGTVLGNSGQGIWKLVTRTGDLSSGKGREVWRDERTGLLWSSLVGTVIGWCKASGNNFIAGNPVAQNDPSDFCDNALYQTTGSIPLKAVSACYEDGGTNFYSDDPSIDNLGKGGLSLSSAPSVAWRLPNLNDYHLAEVNGIRFVLPDMLSNGGAEWTASLVSDLRIRAWSFSGISSQTSTIGRQNGIRTRCVGR